MQLCLMWRVIDLERPKKKITFHELYFSRSLLTATSCIGIYPGAFCGECGSKTFSQNFIISKIKQPLFCELFAEINGKE